MKQATLKLRSLTPITFGKFHQTEKLKGESSQDYEMRTWRERSHVDRETGRLVIPGTMFANCIRESAKYMSIQIPGKGKATYTKHFDSGIIINTNILLDVTKEEVDGTPVHVPSDGRVGGTTRVIKIFPTVHHWEGTIVAMIGDPVITAEVFEEVVINAGNLIGIGTWRPRNRGMNGRFELLKMDWKDNL